MNRCMDTPTPTYTPAEFAAVGLKEVGERAVCPLYRLAMQSRKRTLPDLHPIVLS